MEMELSFQILAGFHLCPCISLSLSLVISHYLCDVFPLLWCGGGIASGAFLPSNCLAFICVFPPYQWQTSAWLGNDRLAFILDVFRYFCRSVFLYFCVSVFLCFCTSALICVHYQWQTRAWLVNDRLALTLDGWPALRCNCDRTFWSRSKDPGSRCWVKDQGSEAGIKEQGSRSWIKDEWLWFLMLPLSWLLQIHFLSGHFEQDWRSKDRRSGSRIRIIAVSS